MLNPPEAVRRIATRLEAAGFETWCVGGAVRDALLSHAHLDWDLATAATPRQVRRLFRRTVPKGIKYGTVGVLDNEGRVHEVTTFRRDVLTDGRHAVVEFGVSLDQDLARRDFTINAIAYSPSTGQIHDPFAGREDLARGVVRAVGNPNARMREDRLRALRAMRFAGRFGFEIERDTWEAVVASAPSLGRLSAERVKEELEKTMEQVDQPSRAFALWRSAGALAALVPALATVSDVTLRSLDELPRATLNRRPQRTINRIAALFAELTPTEADRVLRALRFSNAEVAWVSALLAALRRIGPDLERSLLAGELISDAQLRRWVATAGRTRIASVMRLAHARWAAERRLGRRAPAATAVASLYRRVLHAAFRDPVDLHDLAVDGDDLRILGVAPGPELGRMLRALLDIVIDDPSLNTRDRLLARAEMLRNSRLEPPAPQP